MSDDRKPEICSICKCLYVGWGHNAQPVNNGRCCTECNDLYVIPMRLARIYATEKEGK